MTSPREPVGPTRSAVLRRSLGRTGRPPAWAASGFALSGLVLGLTLGAAASPTTTPALTALVAAFVAMAGGTALTSPLTSAAPLTTRRRLALRLTVAAGVAVGAASLLAGLAAGRWWSAALGMALVALVTSAAAAAGPLWAALGQTATLGYVLTVVVLASPYAPVGPETLAPTARSGLVGIGVGVLVTVIGGWLLGRRPARAVGARTSSSSSTGVAPAQAVVGSLRAFDQHARDGVRRALPLAIGVGIYEANPTRDALWMLLAALVVVMPTGKSPLAAALSRLAGTVVAVAVLLPLVVVAPREVLLVIAVVALILGAVYSPALPVPGGALTALGAVILVAAPTASYGTWALHRVLDTLLGAGIALASTYLLWPQDVPDDGGPPDPDPPKEDS